MEIIQQAGVAAPFLAKGLPWSDGRSFYRGQEVYRMVLPHDADDRFLPGLNLQQQYIEQYLVEAVQRSPLIELRWGSKVVAVQQHDHIAAGGKQSAGAGRRGPCLRRLHNAGTRASCPQG